MLELATIRKRHARIRFSSFLETSCSMEIEIALISWVVVGLRASRVSGLVA